MRPRLVACTPPVGVVAPEFVDVWLDAGIDRSAFVLWLREPEVRPADLLRGRLGPIALRALDHGVAAVIGCGVDRIGEGAGLVRAHGLAGLHLRGDPGRAALLDARDRLGPTAIIGRSCHRPAGDHELCDYAVFGPVFAPHTAKPTPTPPLGLGALTVASRMPDAWLLALGGVDVRTAEACLASGAAGLAGIRSFFGEPGRVAQDVAALRRAIEAATRAPHAD